jgi:hypothetical protein
VKLSNAIRFLGSRNRALVLAVSVCSANLCGAAFAQDQPAGAPAIQVQTDEILVPVLVLDKKRIDAIHRMDIHSYMSEVNAPNSHLLMDLAVTDLAAGEFRFKSSETLDFYFEVFSPLHSGSPAGKIEVHMRMLEAKTGQVVKEILPTDTAPYRKLDDPIIAVGGGIDVANLPSASYQLQARATDSTGQSSEGCPILLGQPPAYSNRSISTGRMRAAERAGTIVAATLIANAAAAIQIASKPFPWNGT